MRLLAERAALREDAARLLGELGGTASEVAVSLCALGVPVRASSSGDSPAARYLNAVVGADTLVKCVRITKRWMVIKTQRRLWPTIWLRLPHPVREFTLSIEGVRPNETTEVPYEGNQA
jgi:hypothetical protein